MLRLVTVLVLAPASAQAEHQHVSAQPGTHSEVVAQISLIAARFENLEYAGDYQGMTPGVSYVRDRYAVATTLGLYRLQENGRELFGVGDAMVHAQVRVFDTAATSIGISGMVMLPTGAHADGLGMGHVMVVPGAWGHGAVGDWSFDGSLGYAKAVTGGEVHHHGDMMWPLVEPMNEQELLWGGGGDYTLTHGLRTGARVSGGLPIGDGVTRVIGGVHVRWTEHRVATTFEIQAGLAGDPFTLRGVLETALRF